MSVRRMAALQRAPLARWYLLAWTLVVLVHPLLHAEEAAHAPSLQGHAARASADTAGGDTCPVCTIESTPGQGAAPATLAPLPTPALAVADEPSAPTVATARPCRGRSPPLTTTG